MIKIDSICTYIKTYHSNLKLIMKENVLEIKLQIRSDRKIHNSTTEKWNYSS